MKNNYNLNGELMVILMTEKRFAVTQTVLGSGIYDFQAEDTLCESYDEDAYGEVCKKLNKLHERNIELKKENNILIKERLGEERLKQEIADYHASNSKLHRLNNELIRRLDKFNINYLDILEDLND